MTDLTSIKGLGEKRIALLNSMGVYSSMDLLKLLPKSYIDFTNQKTISEVQDGELAALTLTVVNPPKFARSCWVSVIVCKVGVRAKCACISSIQQIWLASILRGGIYAYGRVAKTKRNFSAIFYKSPTYSCIA